MNTFLASYVRQTYILFFYTYTCTAVQILFIMEKEHWVVSSCTEGKVSLHDSYFNGKLTPSLEVQLAQMYGSLCAVNKVLNVFVEPSQQQNGSTDCGVHAIANAYNSACGKSTLDYTYESSKIKKHVEDCFVQLAQPLSDIVRNNCSTLLHL